MRTKSLSQSAALLLSALLSVAPLRAAEAPQYVAQFIAKDSASGLSEHLPRRWKSQTSGNVFEVVLRDRVLSIRRVASEDERRSGSELKIDVELRQLGASYVGKTVVNIRNASPEGVFITCPFENVYTITMLTPERIEGSVAPRSLDANCFSVPTNPVPIAWTPTSDTDVSPLANQQPAPIQFSRETTELLNAFDRAIAEKKYALAVKTVQEAIAIVSKQFGPSHGAVALLEGHLGRAYDGMENFEEAINAYQKAVEILAKIQSAEETLWQLRVNLSHALFKAGRRQESIALYEMLLKHHEESKGELHILTFSTRGVLAGSYLISGQLEEAIAQATILVEAARKIYGQESEQQIDAEGLLASIYMQANKFDLASESFDRAYRASERVRGELHAKTLVLGYGYALSLSETGRGDRAASVAEKVYRGRIDIGAPLFDVLESQSLYSRVLVRVGKFEEGDRLLSEGLRIAKGAKPENNEITLKFMDGLCGLHGQWGHYGESISKCRELLAFAESTTGRDSLSASSARQRLAGALTDVGDYDASATLLETDLTLMVPKFGEKHYTVLWTMSRLADSYAQSGRSEEAKTIAEKAYYSYLDTFGPNYLFTQEAGLGLAVIYVRLNEEVRAIALLEKIVDASDRRGGEFNIRVKRELARCYDLAGRKDEAEKLILAALKEAIGLYGLTPNNVTSSLLQVLSSTLRSSGRGKEALPIVEGLYKQTLEKLGPYHTETLMYLLGRANLLLDTGDIKGGVNALGEGLDGIDSWRRITSVFDKGRAEHWSTFSLQFRLAAIIAASQPSQAAMETSFVMGDRAKTGTLYERLSIKKVLNKPGAESQEFSKLLGVERDIEQIDSQIAHTEDDVKRSNLSLDRTKLVSAHESSLRTIAPKFPELIRARVGERVDAKRIAESLNSDTAFVSYLLTPEGGIAYVVTRESGLVIRKIERIPSPVQTIAAARETARIHPSAAGVTLDRLWRLQDGSYRFGKKPSESGDENKNTGELYRYLGEWLVNPIADVLKDKKRLIVSPDELIALLPLEMLKFGGRYLIERFDISYVQSGAMYLLMTEQKRDYGIGENGQRNLFAMGGADYGSPQNSPNVQAKRESKMRNIRGVRDLRLEWEPLPGSKAEVEGVGSLFDEKDKLILLGKAASEERLHKLSAAGELKRFRYLLFSTHGYMSDGDPNLSAIVLTPTGTTDDTDGYLTAVELSKYQLNARLLVLSACDTGVGRYVRGDGVQGLPVAAFLAGTENTLMSLWAVVDETTAEFMKTVFRKIVAGKTEAQAVSETKREFIVHKGGRSYPLFWAPFVLYGI